MKWLVFLSVLIAYTSFYSQSKRFKAYADSITIEKNQIIEKYTWRAFFSSGISDVELDVLEIDQELLDATVYFMINKFRKKSRRKEFVYLESLGKSSSSYAGYYRSSSFRKTEGNKKKSAKAGKYAAKKHGFKGAFIKVLISKPAMLDKDRLKNFYHDINATKENGDDIGIYYGQKPNKGDTTEQVRVPNYTYATFAERVVRQWVIGVNRRTTKSKALKFASCRVILDDKSLFKSKIPYAKAIMVLGGFRTALLPNTSEEVQPTGVEN